MKVRSVAEQLAAPRAAWETVGHRGAVLDALRTCLQETAPLPEWLAPAVEAAVAWWVREAPTTGKHGRHTRPATARRDRVRDLEREAFYQTQLSRGLTPEEARAMTGDWFECNERTISGSLARVKRMAPEERYLAYDDRHQVWSWFTKDPKKAKLELQRLRDLHEQYAPRAKTR
jgi:hypothetical protein